MVFFVLFPYSLEAGELVDFLQDKKNYVNHSAEIRSYITEYERANSSSNLSSKDFRKTKEGRAYWKTKNFLFLEQRLGMCRAELEDTRVIDSVLNLASSDEIYQDTCLSEGRVSNTIAEVGQILKISMGEDDSSRIPASDRLLKTTNNTALTDSIYSLLLYEM